MEASITLDTGLSQLAEARETIERQKLTVALLEEELARTDLHRKIAVERERLSELSTASKMIDEAVRSVALSLYDIDEEKSKSINDFVSIAEHTTYTIDENLAIAWASEHHHNALKLNAAEIKRVAKAGMEVNGVVMGKENRVKIASDLSALRRE